MSARQVDCIQERRNQNRNHGRYSLAKIALIVVIIPERELTEGCLFNVTLVRPAISRDCSILLSVWFKFLLNSDEGDPSMSKMASPEVPEARLTVSQHKICLSA